MKKLFGAFAVIGISALLLCGCSGGVSPIKGDKDDTKVVANVLDTPIYLDEVKYLAYNYKLEMENRYGEGIWDSEDSSEKYQEELKERVEGALKENASFIAVCKEYGVDINDKDTGEYVKEYINSFAEELGGKEEYIKQLAENGMTDRYLRYIIAIDSSREELKTALCKADMIDDSDENARKVIESDEFIRTLHVLIKNDAGEDIEDNRKKAEEVLSKLNEGEPFNRMIGRHSEDVIMTTTDGYYFMRGEYEKAYEDAAFALEIDEYSDVVECSGGFYIIKRLEKESEYIEVNFDSLKDRYIYVKFEEIVDEKAENAEIEYTDFGKELDIAALE